MISLVKKEIKKSRDTLKNKKRFLRLLKVTPTKCFIVNTLKKYNEFR